MSLISQIHSMATSLAAEFKATRLKISGNISGDLSGLATTAKTSLVASVNELKTSIAGKQPTLGFTPENTAKKGAANGYASLDSGGKIPSIQLPSFVDDVIEVANSAALPGAGTSGFIYVTLDTNKTYRWSGTYFVEISQSLALGETSASAYRGDLGKMAYDHSTDVTIVIDRSQSGLPPDYLGGNPHNTTFAQIGSKPTTVAGFLMTDLNTTPEVGLPTSNFVADFEAALI